MEEENVAQEETVPETTVPEKTVAEINKENRETLFKPLIKEEREEEKVVLEARDLADASEMINYANLKKKLILPTITDDEGRPYYIEYCPLRICDRAEIAIIKDKNSEVEINKRNQHAVYLLLTRANQAKWTKEVVYNLPASFIDTILIEYGLAESQRFLQPVLQRSLSGLQSIVMPRSSS